MFRSFISIFLVFLAACDNYQIATVNNSGSGSAWRVAREYQDRRSRLLRFRQHCSCAVRTEPAGASSRRSGHRPLV